MGKSGIGVFALVLGILVLAGLHLSSGRDIEPQAATAANVSDAQIVKAENQPGNWLTYGRTYGEQRFSPLQAINDRSANRLGLAWYFDLDTERGQEATPIVVDGVMYFSTAWS
ncbi:MAG: hypothetical protein WA372_17195, partial [Candidatus Sulfotelmatobacter sp.]